jgi:primosomal replication protein N
MALRAKLVPHSKTETGAGEHRQVQVQLSAVAGPENEEWSRYTPSASFNISLKGDLADQLEIGKAYFVDITEATNA